MFVASYRNTMANARPKLPPPAPPSVDLLRAEKLRQEEAERKAVLEQRRRDLVDRLERAYLRYRRDGKCDPRIEKVPARKIIAAIAAKHGYPVAAIVGPSRKQEYVAIRFEAIRAVAEARPDLSLPAIGRAFNRDHTTILNALRKTTRPGEDYRGNPLRPPYVSTQHGREG